MLRIATWNVNSIRQRIDHLCRWLDELKPDVVLLQEIKSTEETFPWEAIEEKGFHVEISGQKTFNGVAVLSKFPIHVELNSLPGDMNDEQARYLEAVTGGVRVASIYLPNGTPVDDPTKYKYKLNWMERLYQRVEKLLQTEEAFVLGGDYNVIPTDADVYAPDEWRKDALFKLETRRAFRKILYLGLTDAFRAHNYAEGQYTYWDYRGGAWNRDLGLRIDHLLLSPQAADRLIECDIDKTPRGWEKASDHTPIWCSLENGGMPKIAGRPAPN